MRLLAKSLLVLALLATPALAVQPDEILKDPVLEGRARALSQELRCMVCQNQSIDRFRRTAGEGLARAGARAAHCRR